MSGADGGATVLEAGQDAGARQRLGDLRLEAGLAGEAIPQRSEGRQPGVGPIAAGAVDERQVRVDAPHDDARQPGDRSHELLRLLDGDAEPAEARIDLDPDRCAARRGLRHGSSRGEVVHRGLETACDHVRHRGGGGAGEQQDGRRNARLADRHRLLEGAGGQPVGALGARARATSTAPWP